MQETIRQRMQESVYQTADADDSLSDSRCRRLSIRQRMQETLYLTANAGVSLSDICAGVSLSDSVHPLSDRVSPASAL